MSEKDAETGKVTACLDKCVERMLNTTNMPDPNQLACTETYRFCETCITKASRTRGRRVRDASAGIGRREEVNFLKAFQAQQNAETVLRHDQNGWLGR